MKKQRSATEGKANEELDNIRATPIEDVAKRLEIVVERHKALCPFHNDRHPSLRFKGNRFKCFACGESGDVIDLVMRYLNIGFREAVEWIGDTAPLPPGGGVSHAVGKSGDLEIPPPGGGGAVDLEYLSTLVAHPIINAEAAHFLYEERKIDPRVVRWCGLTSISEPMPCWRWGKAFYDAPSLLIPYYDVNHNLLSVQGRRLAPLPPGGGCCNAAGKSGYLEIPPPGGGGAVPRFRFPRGSHVGMYNKPVIKRLRAGDELWITEGPSDCWAMLSAGHKAVAIPSATSLTKADIGLLRDGLPEGVSLHMYPDNDEPGMRLFEGLKRWFPELQGHVLPEGFKDFGQWYANRG